MEIQVDNIYRIFAANRWYYVKSFKYLRNHRFLAAVEEKHNCKPEDVISINGSINNIIIEYMSEFMSTDDPNDYLKEMQHFWKKDAK